MAAFRDDHEFVARNPRQGVARADPVQQPDDHLPEDDVPGRVSEGVVDRLEVVEVHEEQTHLAPVSSRAVQ
jgi:hypothetical protein